MSESIYDDLMDTDLGENILKLERINQALQKHIEKLEGDVLKLCTELTEMKRIQQNLTCNISELFKTAKTEIARKDRMIADLRSELDSLIFKRQSKVVPSEPVKRFNENFDNSEVKRQKSEDSYTSRSKQEDDRKRREPGEFDTRHKHEDLKYSGDRSKWNATENDHRRLIESPNSRNKHRNFRYATSGHPRSHDTHRSRRHSRDRSSRSHRRRSESNKRKSSAEKMDMTTSIDVKTAANSDSAGVSSSSNELQLKDEPYFPVSAQEDLVDSTVLSQQSSTSVKSEFNDMSESGEVVELRESTEIVSAPVQVPTVLNHSCNSDASLSNNSALSKKPLRRRRCVIQIMD